MMKTAAEHTAPAPYGLGRLLAAALLLVVAVSSRAENLGTVGIGSTGIQAATGAGGTGAPSERGTGKSESAAPALRDAQINLRDVVAGPINRVDLDRGVLEVLGQEIRIGRGTIMQAGKGTGSRPMKSGSATQSPERTLNVAKAAIGIRAKPGMNTL